MTPISSWTVGYHSNCTLSTLESMLSMILLMFLLRKLCCSNPLCISFKRFPPIIHKPSPQDGTNYGQDDRDPYKVCELPLRPCNEQTVFNGLFIVIVRPLEAMLFQRGWGGGDMLPIIFKIYIKFCFLRYIFSSNIIIYSLQISIINYFQIFTCKYYNDIFSFV